MNSQSTSTEIGNMITLQEWLNLLRADLRSAEPLVCPFCEAIISDDSITVGSCKGCNVRFAHETQLDLAKHWALWIIAASLAILLVVSMLRSFPSLLASAPGKATGKEGALITLIAVGGYIGLFIVVVRLSIAGLHYYSPFKKTSQKMPQIVLAKIASLYDKRGDLQKAARFYAELLTYGHIDNFSVNTGRAYDCWKKLGTEAQNLAFSAPFRDLLFYERMIRHAEQRERGDREFASGALQYLKELVTLASNSERLLILGDIYHGDGRLSRIAEALRGNFLSTNSVSGAESVVSDVSKPLKGLFLSEGNYPKLVNAFSAKKRRNFPFFKPMVSATKPNRDPSTIVREETCSCCQCGTVTNCKGLDVYAVFPYGISSAGTTIIWSRYLGCLELRLCAECYILNAVTPDARKSELMLYRAAISRFVVERRGYLIAACPLGAVFNPPIEPKQVYACEPRYVRFLIEPPMEEGKRQDLADVKWNTWISSEYERFSPIGERGPATRNLG